MPASRRKPAVPIVPPPYWDVSPQQVQEELSYAYVHAVCSHAGCIAKRLPPPDHGIDVDVTYMTKVNGFQCPNYEMRLQLKATYTANVYDDHIKHYLKLSDYEKLRHPKGLPKFLILFLMPRNVDQWLTSNERILSIRKCAYWLDMKSHSATPNKDGVTIAVSRSNVFDVSALRDQIYRIVEHWYET
jgi:hypothetical protein